MNFAPLARNSSSSHLRNNGIGRTLGLVVMPFRSSTALRGRFLPKTWAAIWAASFFCGARFNNGLKINGLHSRRAAFRLN
jgi:hypothetical protein